MTSGRLGMSHVVLLRDNDGLPTWLIGLLNWAARGWVDGWQVLPGTHDAVPGEVREWAEYFPISSSHSLTHRRFLS